MTAIGGSGYLEDGSSGGTSVLGLDIVENLVIENGIKIINIKAFYNCTSLVSITIGKGLTSIGSSAFKNCSSLASITISNNVTSIENWVFQNCTILESVTINNPNCSIYDSKYTISDTATIYGYENSTAQAYAEKYGRNFVTITE